MKIKEVISALEMFAPLPLQDGFDNAGLQVGLTDVEATERLCRTLRDESNQARHRDFFHAYQSG